MEQLTPIPAQPQIRVDPEAVLPKGWNVRSDVLLIVGAGGTHVARPFRQHGTERVIVYLPRGTDPADQRAGAAIVRSRQELADHLQLMGQPSVEKFATMRSPWCSMSEEETNGVFATFRQLLAGLRGQQKVSDEFGPLWAKNSIMNMPHFAQHPMATDLKDAFAGVPLIIVGAGPSLDKNIHLLRAAQGKAVILSVSRALRTLHNAGVTPNIAMVLDPQKVAYQFEGIDASRIDALAVDITVNPKLFDVGVSRHIGFASNTHALQWMLQDVPDVVALPTGGSVSCSALSLGLRLGCNPIMLVGQDLSFSEDAYYASNGVDADTRAVLDTQTGCYRLEGYSEQMGEAERFQASEQQIRHRAATVPGYHGGQVSTSSDFAAFRLWFENTALDCAGQVRLVNCTEGGAYIGGMEHLPLAEVLTELDTRTVDVGVVLDTAGRPDRKTPLHKVLVDMHRALPKIITLAERCVRLIDVSLQSGAMHAGLKDAEARLRVALRAVRVLSLMNQEEIRGVLASAAEAKDPREGLRHSRRLYALVAREAPQLMAPTQDALNRF